MVLYLGFPSDSAIESPERHDLFFLQYFFQIASGTTNVHSFDGLGSLSRVLQRQKDFVTETAVSVFVEASECLEVDS